MELDPTYVIPNSWLDSPFSWNFDADIPHPDFLDIMADPTYWPSELMDLPIKAKTPVEVGVVNKEDRPKRDDWLMHRDIILDLYIGQGRTAKETQQYMSEYYDFHAS